MSQAKTIYDFFTHSPSPAADAALLQGLHLAEPPYQTAILQTILQRGKPHSTSEIIRDYHTYPAHWKELIHPYIDHLHSGIRQADLKNSPQTRMNILNLIQRTRCFALLDILGAFLRDRERPIAQKAGGILLSMAEFAAHKLQREKNAADQFKNFLHLFTSAGTGLIQTHPNRLSILARQNLNEVAELSYLIPTLHLALRQFPKYHTRNEAILACMYLVPADAHFFWQGALTAYHPVGEEVKRILIRCDEPQLAGFALSSLDHSFLGPAVIRGLRSCSDEAFILKFSRLCSRQTDSKQIARLKFVKEANWLNETFIQLACSLEAQEQQDLICFLLSLGIDRQKLSTILTPLVPIAHPETLEEMIRWSSEEAGPCFDLLQRIAESPSALAAKQAVESLLRMRSPHLNRIMARQLRSPHGQVKALAREYFQNIAFKRFWQNFDRLTPAQRKRGSDAVFKIDPSFGRQWQHYALEGTAKERLRAVLLARQGDLVGELIEPLKELTRDSDQRVRSCAVASLGQVRDPENTAVQESLEKSLMDPDDRVCANAIEALEHRKSVPLVKKILPFVHHDNNRVRANAIKTLAGWKVHAAREAVHQMLHDPRRVHRKSGTWVLGQIEDPEEILSSLFTERLNVPLSV